MSGDKHPVRVTLQLTKNQLLQLSGVAGAHGYLRENPRKAWSVPELKDAARHAVQALAEVAAKSTVL